MVWPEQTIIGIFMVTALVYDLRVAEASGTHTRRACIMGGLTTRLKEDIGSGQAREYKFSLTKAYVWSNQVDALKIMCASAPQGRLPGCIFVLR